MVFKTMQLNHSPVVCVVPLNLSLNVFTSFLLTIRVLTSRNCLLNIYKSRFYCATSADNRTRLDFHGERRIWNGRLIKQKIKGNSALYIYTDEV